MLYSLLVNIIQGNQLDSEINEPIHYNRQHHGIFACLFRWIALFARPRNVTSIWSFCLTRWASENKTTRSLITSERPLNLSFDVLLNRIKPDTCKGQLHWTLASRWCKTYGLCVWYCFQESRDRLADRMAISGGWRHTTEKVRAWSYVFGLRWMIVRIFRVRCCIARDLRYSLKNHHGCATFHMSLDDIVVYNGSRCLFINGLPCLLRSLCGSLMSFFTWLKSVCCLPGVILCA